MSMPPVDPFKLEAHKAALQKDVEQYKATLSGNLEHWKSERETERISHRATVDLSIGAMKTLLLINGGAAIAVLAFLGNALSKGDVGGVDVARIVAAVRIPLLWFIGGTFLAGVTYAVAYITQVFFSEMPDWKSRKKWGNPTRFVALALAALSLISFLCGALSANNGFKRLQVLEYHVSSK